MTQFPRNLHRETFTRGELVKKIPCGGGRRATSMAHLLLEQMLNTACCTSQPWNNVTSGQNQDLVRYSMYRMIPEYFRELGDYFCTSVNT